MNRAARWLRATDLWIYAAAGALTAALTAVALQLWKADLTVPLTYRGDALPVGAHIKTVLEEGWYEFQPNLGAPHGQTYNDFPTADNLHLVVTKILGLFTGDWAVALNAYFLLGFLLIALAAVWLLRVCRVSPWLTIALATLFALAPYHFIRGESHLFLASYYAVPLAIGLLVFVLRGEQLWGWHASRTGVLRYVLSPTLRTLVILGILGTSSSYYSVFFLVLVAAAGIFTLLRDRSWRRFWGAAAAGVTTVFVMVLNMLPDVLFTLANGQNPLGLERSGGEAEFYALKLSQLLLPWPGHRIDALASLRQRYDSAYVSLGEQPALGAIGAIGLVAALLIIAYLAFSRMSRATAPVPGGRFELVAGLSGLVFVAFIFSTLGGLSTIVSIFTSSLRGWNRMSIVIMMLCLAIVGLLVDLAIARAGDRFSWRTLARTGIAGGVALLLVVVGFIDQTPGNGDREYAGNEASFSADAEYFGAIQDSLPVDAMVLVTPYVPYPESNAATGLLASDQLVPYLHTTTVRWSNGGIKGRPTADWPGELGQYGDENLATLAAAAGFSGVLVDRAAALDRGAAVEAALEASTGERPVVHPGGRFAFFDLSPVTRALSAEHDDAWFTAAADAITNPVVAYRTPDFYPNPADLSTLIVDTGSAQFSMVNASDADRTVELSFVVSPTIAEGRVSVSLPDGSAVDLPLDPDGTTVTASVAVAPGSHPVTVTLTDASGAPAPGITVSVPTVRNPEITRLLAAEPAR